VGSRFDPDVNPWVDRICQRWARSYPRSWDTPAPGLSWPGVRAAGQGVLAAVDVGILMAGVKRPRLAHLKSPVRARPGLVTRSLRTQIIRFGTAPDSRPGDQVANWMTCIGPV